MPLVDYHVVKNEKPTTKDFFQRSIRQDKFFNERISRDPTYNEDVLYADEPQWTVVRSRTSEELPQYHPFFMARGKRDGTLLKLCKDAQNLVSCLLRRMAINFRSF